MRKTVWFYEAINKYTGEVKRFFSRLYVDEISEKLCSYFVDCIGWIEDNKITAHFGEFAEE